jgi:hypothetical protein
VSNPRWPGVSQSFSPVSSSAHRSPRRAPTADFNRIRTSAHLRACRCHPIPYLLVLGAGTGFRVAPTIDGAPARFDATRLDERAVLLHVETHQGRKLTVELEHRTVEYPIDPDWERGQAASPDACAG